MKKIMALTLMLMMLVSTVCFAAVSSSGSKSSSSSSSKSSTSAPASTSKTAPTGTDTYKPSAPASSYSDKAPAKQPAPGVQQNSPSQSTGSSFWRNASLFGGGMLAGSMLGNLFGYGNNMGMGGGSSLFGMLLNLLIIGGVIMGIRFLWDKYKNKNRDMR